MSADGIVRHLLEEPESNPLDIPELDRYTGPLEFDQNIRDIIEHAKMLKQQAEQAGALNLIMRPNAIGSAPKQVDIDRAFLIIAVEQYDDEFKMPEVYARRLKREMHSIWD